jgi:hypothetical protein
MSLTRIFATLAAITGTRHAARRRLGDHKQQAEEREREREEMQIQDELHQGGVGWIRRPMYRLATTNCTLSNLSRAQFKALCHLQDFQGHTYTVLLEAPVFKMPGSIEYVGSAASIVLREVSSLTRDQQQAFFALQIMGDRHSFQELAQRVRGQQILVGFRQSAVPFEYDDCDRSFHSQ